MKTYLLAAVAALSLAGTATADPPNGHWISLGHQNGGRGWVADTTLPPLRPGDYPKTMVLMDPDKPTAFHGAEELLAIQDVDCVNKRLRTVLFAEYRDRHQKHLITRSRGDMVWGSADDDSPGADVLRISCAASE